MLRIAFTERWDREVHRGRPSLAAFARTGKRVLHIGCDPKADSTRCLTSGRIPTVLETLGRSEELLAREQLVFPGAFGVSCVEAGGPQAGAGCAGLGITAMADELNRLGILEEPGTWWCTMSWAMWYAEGSQCPCENIL